jgi:hypothetical protein
MRNRPLAWAAAAALLPFLGAGTAMADVAPGQAVGQTAASQQTANADANSTQVAPTNENVSVRVLSSGDDGAVTQSNTSAAEAAAANANATLQAAGQSAPSGGTPAVAQAPQSAPAAGSQPVAQQAPSAPSGGTQAVAQQAQSAQAADASANSAQVKPTNQNISVRVLSDGNDGDVSQSNTSDAAALAANADKTAQVAEQAGGGGGGGNQAVAQKAANEQQADADAHSVQDHPSNVNAPVRVLSDGNGGDVEQSNASAAEAAALNANETVQKAAQDQGRPQAPAPAYGDGCQACSKPQSADQTADQPKGGSGGAQPIGGSGGYQPKGQSGGQQPQSEAPACGCAPTAAPAVQAIGQKALNGQSADADATSKQIGAKNVNAPVRAESAGDGGNVTQSNDSLAAALAANGNVTGQLAQQAQGGRSPGTVGIQAIGQLAKSRQDADASATSLQAGATNVNAPVGVLSPRGGGGDVSQRNSSLAGALALNLNATKQIAAQDMGGGSGPLAIQAIGQAAFNDQRADADAASFQLWPANVNAPVSVGGEMKRAPAYRKGERPMSEGSSSPAAPAGVEGPYGNEARPGGHMGDVAPYGDASGDRHAPARLEPMEGGDGSVEQANDSAALAAGLNGNWTGQLAFQG